MKSGVEYIKEYNSFAMRSRLDESRNLAIIQLLIELHSASR